jgi:ribosomal protein S27AE
LERLEPEAWGREVAPIAAEVEAAVDVDGLRYEPVDCVSRAESPHDAHGARAQCGRCCSLVAGGAVVNSPARWSDVAAGRVMTRTLFCSHCGHLQQWVEGATPAGQPNGAVVSGPEYVDGPAVGDFLRQHPEAIGVMVE